MYVSPHYTESTERKFQTMSQYILSSLRDSIENVVEVVTDVNWEEVFLGVVIALGVVATLLLIYKLFISWTVRRSSEDRIYSDSRLSIGSLEMYVKEKLQDPPPRYSTTSPSSTEAVGAENQNSTLKPDSNVPPPPYTERNESCHHSTLHI